MAALIKPIKPKRISDQVFEQLRELIYRGQLKPGEQLMPERELAAAMSVSRTTIRNAINKLVVMGLLEHKQGQGTFVRAPSATNQNLIAQAMDSQNPSLENLLEVRMGLECNAAALAARRADYNDIELLKKSMVEMQKGIKSGRLGTEGDVTFHMAIAYATKNPVQVYLMKSFYDYLFYGIKKNLFYLYEEPDRIDIIVEQHRKIFEAIQSHDPKEALAAMSSHIQYVQDFFRKKENE